MSDQRFQYSEEVVGANHGSKSDTINRLALVAHNNDGTHKFSGALVYKSANQSINDSTETVVSWDLESRDTDAYHDNATNNSRLTIPSGVTRVRLYAHVYWASNSTGLRALVIKKNGAVLLGCPRDRRAASGDAGQSLATPMIDVTAGDYFEAYVTQTSGGALNVIGDASSSYFAIEAVL